MMDSKKNIIIFVLAWPRYKTVRRRLKTREGVAWWRKARIRGYIKREQATRDGLGTKEEL